MSGQTATAPAVTLRLVPGAAPEAVLELQAVTKIYPGRPPVPALRG
jgi:hypothetical protein